MNVMSTQHDSTRERDRRAIATDDTTVVYVALEGDRRHDPRAWDDLLAAAVRRLRSEVRTGDSVGRYGDGILALLSGVRGELGPLVASRMVAALDGPVESERGQARVAARASVEQVGPGERLDEAASRASRG